MEEINCERTRDIVGARTERLVGLDAAGVLPDPERTGHPVEVRPADGEQRLVRH